MYSFFEAAALSPIVLRYAGALIAIRVSFFFPFVCVEMSIFPSIVCTIAVFSLYGEYVVRFCLPDGVFYLVTKGWIFDISLRENSIKQSINREEFGSTRIVVAFPHPAF